MRKQSLLGIDILRFIAASVVVLYHLAFWVSAWPAGLSGRAAMTPIAANWLTPGAKYGWIGVEIFFVISGFVIAFSANGATPAKFAKGRFLRLAPAAWLIAPLSGLVLILTNAAGVGEAIRRTFYSMAFRPFGPWVDSVYWTLGIEIVFYALVWVLLASKRWAFIETLLSMLGILSAAFWLVVFSGRLGVESGRMTQLALLDHGCFFALGGMLWLLQARGFTWWRLAMAALAIAVGLAEISSETTEHVVKTGVAANAAVPMSIWLVAILAMGASIFWRDRVNALIGSDRLARVLGLSTYPLYLCHNVIGSAIVGALTLSGVSGVPAVLVAAGLMVALALLVSTWAEPALRRLVGELLPPWRRLKAKPA